MDLSQVFLGILSIRTHDPVPQVVRGMKIPAVSQHNAFATCSELLQNYKYLVLYGMNTLSVRDLKLLPVCYKRNGEMPM